MKHTILALIAITAVTGSIHAAPEATKGSSTLEFKSYKEIPKEAGGVYTALTPGTFYFYNGSDNPAAEPVVGDDNGIKFIGVKGLTQEPITSFAKSSANLLRIVKVPANAPKTIQCNFQTRFTSKEVDGSWASDKRNQAFLQIRFNKGTFTGGGVVVKLNPNGQWEKQEVKLNVPAGAEFLVIKLRADAGDEVDLGNWTIQ